MQLLAAMIRGLRTLSVFSGQATHAPWEFSVGLAVSAVTHVSAWVALSVVVQQSLLMDVPKGENSVEISLAASAPSTAATEATEAMEWEVAAPSDQELAEPVEMEAAKQPARRVPSDSRGEAVANDLADGEQSASTVARAQERIERTSESTEKPAATRRKSVPKAHSAASPSINTKAEIGVPLERPPQTQPANDPPAYPPEALEQGLAGTVLLRLSVTAAGDVGEIRVERSSGSELLDDAALQKVKQWRFVPAVMLGVEVAAEVRIPIVFRLEIDEPDASDEAVENAE